MVEVNEIGGTWIEPRADGVMILAVRREKPKKKKKWSRDNQMKAITQETGKMRFLKCDAVRKQGFGT